MHPHAVMGSFACFSRSAAGEKVLQSAHWAEAGSMLCGTEAACPVQQRSPHCLLFAGVRGAIPAHTGAHYWTGSLPCSCWLDTWGINTAATRAEILREAAGMLKGHHYYRRRTLPRLGTFLFTVCMSCFMLLLHLAAELPSAQQRPEHRTSLSLCDVVCAARAC